MQKWLLTGLKTIIGMVFVIFGAGIKALFPDLDAIGDVLINIGAVLGGGGLLHKTIRGIT